MPGTSTIRFAPWILSARLMVYRGAMLLWSLWLALASLGWARWIWQCVRAEGWWQPLRPKVVTVTVTAAPAGAAPTTGSSAPDES